MDGQQQQKQRFKPKPHARGGKPDPKQKKNPGGGRKNEPKGGNRGLRLPGGGKKARLVDRAAAETIQEALGKLDAQAEEIRQLREIVDHPVEEPPQNIEGDPVVPEPLFAPAPPPRDVPAHQVIGPHDHSFVVQYWASYTGNNEQLISVTKSVIYALIILMLFPLSYQIGLMKLFFMMLTGLVVARKSYIVACANDLWDRTLEIHGYADAQADQRFIRLLDCVSVWLFDLSVCVCAFIICAPTVYFGGPQLAFKVAGVPLYGYTLFQIMTGDGGVVLAKLHANLSELYYTPLIFLIFFAVGIFYFSKMLTKHKYTATMAPKEIWGDKRPDYMCNQELKHTDDLRYKVCYEIFVLGWVVYTKHFYISGELFAQLQGLRVLNAFDDFAGACRRLEAYAKNLGTVNYDRYDFQDPFKFHMTTGLAGALSNELREKLAEAGFPGARPL